METDNLLAKYFGGNATENDLLQLEKWIASSPENEAEFMRMTRLYELTGMPESDSLEINTNEAKQKFRDYRAKSAEKKHVKFRSANNLRNWLAGVAAVGLLLLASTLLWEKFDNNRIVISAQLQSLKTELPDATTINLSAGSTLTYDASFAKQNKEITLNGEARFDVGGLGNGKLRVVAGETFIEDIGTVFEVSAYDNHDYVQVKVAEGLVKFYTATDKGIIVHARETGIYDKLTKKLSIAASCNFENGNELVHLNLDGVTLQQAVKIIENAYRINIKLGDGDFADKQITVTFTNEKPGTVLSVMSQTLGLKLEKNGDNFLLRK
jgi:ferric-dicitrate binding protein FerR (iron transport regulator)